MARTASFHNLGCKVNAYEVEAMQELLAASGYELVPFSEPADVCVINTCTVTNMADHKSRQMLHRARKANPEAVIVAVGCYAQLKVEELQNDPAVDLVIGTDQKGKLPGLLEAYFRNQASRQTDLQWESHPVYEPLQITGPGNHTRAFLKIQDGCDRYCSYCIIPYARGPVRSRPLPEIREEAGRLAASGVRELVLTGIHICSYGKDLSEEGDLLTVLQAVHEIEGIDRIRLSSLEPSYMTEERIATLTALPKVCPHFHLSLQSGCDATLARMQRRYRTADYAATIALFRRYYQNPAMTTDVITGFPGETEAEFAETKQFVEQMRFFETHVFPYSRREGTKAASLEGQLPASVKKARCQELLELDARRRREYLQTFVGKPVEVLFEEKQQGVWEGYGRAYQRVLLASEQDLHNVLLEVTPGRVENGALLA